MPTPFMCHECDAVTMNISGVCDKCLKELAEPTTADDNNKKWLREKKKKCKSS